MTDTPIKDLVEQWLQIDINPVTREEIIRLAAEGDTDELEKRLRRRIQFGTAGLRSSMEAGFSRLNDVTILQATQGLASYISGQTENRSVVIGHDHRLNSKRFAEITATNFIIRGFKVYYLSSPSSDTVPTPLVPFAVDYFQAAGGVMITASHNPAKDNGYKVYWGNGCQIIPPHDKGIADEILKNLEPIQDAYEIEKVFRDGVNKKLLIYSKEEILTAYLLHLNSEVVTKKITSLKYIYTPMHGVGLEVFSKVASLIGSHALYTVKEQSQPDPYFPTVKFPNPEERGALDLAIKKAEEHNFDLVIANDPDADRFSAAVKHKGKWRQLTGNEIGFLFADYIIKNFHGDFSKIYLLNSTVSSQMIASMAKILGFKYADTLTGFKWIGNKAIELETAGYEVPFAFEEAIGFMFRGIHDKDGLAAASVFLQMAQTWKDEGTNAVEVLEDGFRKYGFFKEYNSYYIVPDLDLIKEIFDGIRHSSENGDEAKPYPSTVGQYRIASWRDLTLGYQSDTVNNIPDLPVDPSSQMITLTLTTKNDFELVRLTMRGSGTEPKLKVYIEAKAPTEEAANFLATDVWRTLQDVWFRPANTGLIENGA